MKVRFLTVSAMIVALAGCQNSQEAVKQDPKAAFGRCMANVATWNITAKHEATAFMGVSAANMPTVFCRRLVDAMLSGRLTFSDINRLQTNQSTDVWRVIKGK
jgi:nitrous oxide reductase accessory protein NosL